MKFCILLLLILISGCSTTKNDVLVDSNIYTYSYTERNKVKLNTVVMRPGTDRAGLILEDGQPKALGNRVYFSRLYVWSKNMNEFISILEDILSKPDDQSTEVKIKLGANSSTITTKIFKSELYVSIFSLDGSFLLSRNDVFELIKTLKSIKSGAGS